VRSERSGTALAPERLRTDAASVLGRPLSDLELERLVKYVQLLIKWQRSQRLVGSSEPDWIIDHIVIDSLLFARLLPSTTDRILDIGSGAGVPGIPLKIVNEQISFTLLEARPKRVSFLSAVVRELALVRCDVVNERLEAVADERSLFFDVAVLRCAGNPADLLAAALQVLKPGGVVIAAGPPRRRPTLGVDWIEVEGPRGSRLFWVARKA
jgi:16S rRNA (guanine527-N7)-methyltransferase